MAEQWWLWYDVLYPSDDDDDMMMVMMMMMFLLIAIPRASLHQGAGQGSGLRYGEAVNPLTFLVSNDHLDDLDDLDNDFCGESSDLQYEETINPLTFVIWIAISFKSTDANLAL